ncbi:helix-turn-helix transcriptional regulator [Nonomuraea sp. NN258]|uniref:helix-turn-helix domain-containing protein n=1 Tax=Nonomuraea antri TaxID=2730852 RepID=UPI0015683DF7|nr:helix-turn-helix transcriptional regulator [Nonomuraea antri]NRQ33581.1 helix-turn-helix transcriptional regulator [Nonomuraea antri]
MSGTPSIATSWAEFGHRLRFWRRSSGLTQAQLGLRLGYHHSHISRIEKGLREPPAGLPTRADRVLGTEGELNAIWTTLTARPRQHTHAPGRADATGPARAGPAAPDRAEAADPADPGLVASLIACRPATLPADGLPCPLHDRHGCAVPGTPHAPAGEWRDADAVHEMTALLAAYTRVHSRHAAADLAVPVERSLRTLMRWIEDARSPDRTAPARLAARYAQLAGWLRVQRGQHGPGLAWYGLGLRWADLTGDTEARAALLGDLSMVARLVRDARAALGYARAMAASAHGRAWVLTAAGLHEARAHAMTGDAARTDRHLAQARTRFARLDARDAAEAPWLTGEEGVARVEAATAAALRDLALLTGEPVTARRALSAAQTAAARVPGPMRPAHLLLTLRLADVYACAGQPDAAVATARFVLAEAAGAGRATIDRELRGLRTRLGVRWAALPEARELDLRLGHPHP